MSEMVERVAKAIEGAVVGDMGIARIAARAAIEAMREPTEAMVSMAWDETDPLPEGADLYARAWQSMIDEALK